MEDLGWPPLGAEKRRRLGPLLERKERRGRGTFLELEKFGLGRLEVQGTRGLGHILERSTGYAPGPLLEREERFEVGLILELKGMRGLGLEGFIGLGPFSKWNTRRKSGPLVKL